MNITELIERLREWSTGLDLTDIDKAVEALLAQQAVIEQMHDALMAYCPSPQGTEWFKKHIAARNAKPNLSALREHDAEVVKAFVDALATYEKDPQQFVIEYIERIRKGE